MAQDREVAVGGLWDCMLPRVDRRGAYIAISGNTAAGKSSLIAELARLLQMLGHDVIGVSEREFHHRYLPLMFSERRDFAFPIQVSFMLDRHMVLLRNLVGLGRIVILERSHLDDRLFLREHRSAGFIDDDQYEAYENLATVLHARIPLPDLLILMNPDPELSISRLKIAEQQGDRPCEFPDEASKKTWVYRWHGLYEELHRDFRHRKVDDPSFSSVNLVELDPGQTTKHLAAQVLKRIDQTIRR